MILVLYNRIPARLDSIAFESRMAALPDAFHPGIRKYKRPADSLRSLAAKLLLQKAAEYFGLIEPYGYTVDSVNGRPFFSSQPDFDFSLSHSGEMAICAASSVCRIGIDIEKNRGVDLDLFSSILSGDEFHTLRESATPDRDFFKLWCAKEAVAKTHGKGVFLPFASLKVEHGLCKLNEVCFTVKEITAAKGYTAMLAFEGEQNTTVDVREVQF